MKKLHIIDKYFSTKDNLFHINFGNQGESVFNSFDEFYVALGKNLRGVKLYNYNFEGVDIKKYDLSKAKLSSDMMIKLGIYKDDLFKKITKDKELSNITHSVVSDLVPSRRYSIDDIGDNKFVLCYISDLHINHKLVKRYKNAVNKFELDDYFKQIINNLKNSLPTFSYDFNIVFIGDISYNFEVFKMFFKAFRKEIPYHKTFVIIGNHELWDTRLNKKCKSIEDTIFEYRTFLGSLDNEIYLLENQLFLPNDKQHFYSQEEILTIDRKVLREKFLHNSYAIFGGIGYAGMNNEFNADQGIYRTSFINREQEKERSRVVDSLHQRLTEVASDKKIFFITHMPKEDWSNNKYNKNWIYVSGHTHKNIYIESDDRNVYADNQVGYTKESFGFKYLFVPKEFDIFQDYVDGIYEITREQYRLFYYGLGNRIDFNRNFANLFMLKRQGVYCFLLKQNKNSELKLLNGGCIKDVGKHDINYFYENLINYSNSIKLFIKSYSDFQKNISNEIKRIGGSGYIHGCIVDIDYYNHVYINPLDNTITPYFALSMTEKYVYKNVISLLKSHNKELYDNLLKLLVCKDNQNKLIVLNKNLQESNEYTLVSDTDIYKISRILKSIQYTTKYNIVRLWNDTIISNSTIESGRLIVSGIINPEEMKQLKTQQKQIERQRRVLELHKQKQLSKEQLKEEKKKILFDKYCQKISSRNENIKVLSYIGSREKASYKCLLCNYEWFYRADRFLEKCKCPRCKK